MDRPVRDGEDRLLAIDGDGSGGEILEFVIPQDVCRHHAPPFCCSAIVQMSFMIESTRRRRVYEFGPCFLSAKSRDDVSGLCDVVLEMGQRQSDPLAREAFELI